MDDDRADLSPILAYARKVTQDAADVWAVRALSVMVQTVQGREVLSKEFIIDTLAELAARAPGELIALSADFSNRAYEVATLEVMFNKDDNDKETL